MAKRTVLAYSGGLDSTVLLYKLLEQGDEVYPLAFSYGSKHNTRELEAADRICAKVGLRLKTVRLDFVKELTQSALLEGGEGIPSGKASHSEQSKVVIPGRNSIFGSVLIGYADGLPADRIALAIHADDHSIFPDTRPEWAAALRLLAYHGTLNRVGLYTPFAEVKKDEICKIGAAIKVPFELTWTCYQGGEKPCGRCTSCTVRRDSFTKAGFKDPALVKS